MKVLVTGGAGFIGSHLVEALVAQDHDVVVLDDLSTGKLQNLAAVAERITFIRGDVADGEVVEAAATGCTLIYHQAAIASVPKTIEDPIRTNAVNLGGTLNVLQAARAVGARRVIFAGSAAVYGDRSDGPVCESDDPNPLSPYAVEKLASEQYTSVWAPLFDLETVTLRYFNVFGPRQDPSSPYSGVISVFVDRCLSSLPCTIYGDGEQTRDFVSVHDVVRANLAAGRIEAPKGLVCNIAGGRSISLNTLYEMISTLVGEPAPVAYGAARRGDVRRSLANVDRARQVLDFSASVSVRDGLAELVEWAKDQRQS